MSYFFFLYMGEVCTIFKGFKSSTPNHQLLPTGFENRLIQTETQE